MFYAILYLDLEGRIFYNLCLLKALQPSFDGVVICDSVIFSKNNNVNMHLID